jgi:hypothetical protein
MQPVFAGAAQVNLPMPTVVLSNGAFSDAVVWPARGSTLATYAIMNLNSAISNGWQAEGPSSPLNQGSGCPNVDGNFTYGGGRGFNGCGAYVSIGMDSSVQRAHDDVASLTWLSVQNESNRSTGNTYWVWGATCNYDCVKYPMSK